MWTLLSVQLGGVATPLSHPQILPQPMKVCPWLLRIWWEWELQEHVQHKPSVSYYRNAMMFCVWEAWNLCDFAILKFFEIFVDEWYLNLSPFLNFHRHVLARKSAHNVSAHLADWELMHIIVFCWLSYFSNLLVLEQLAGIIALASPCPLATSTRSHPQNLNIFFLWWNCKICKSVV